MGGNRETAFGLTDQDLAKLSALGVDEGRALAQLRILAEGPSYRRLARAATAGDGILRLTEAEAAAFSDRFDHARSSMLVECFVPASGAASRMFLSLERYRASKATRADLEAEAQRRKPGEDDLVDVVTFLRRIDDFAFARALDEALRRDGLDLAHLMKSGPVGTIVDYVLSPLGLGYRERPKALIPFHRYGDETRTAFEEHLVEADAYARGTGGVARVHFTVSPEHEALFLESRARALDLPRWQAAHLEVSLTQQRASTATLALDEAGRPFRAPDGNLLLRAGGHGALIENVAELEGQVVFVKNIDNVAREDRAAISYRSKRMLGGLLLAVQGRVFEDLEALDAGTADLEVIRSFARTNLGVVPPPAFGAWTPDRQRAYLRSKLERPIRVCGMVRNEGEPGGGPFWVVDDEGAETLQVVESLEVHPSDPEQRGILAASTHFNPVDLVLGVWDRRGRKHDLRARVNQSACFLSRKSFEGRTLTALELPGLWNGAMADWNTLFVEVSNETFCPVKKVVDLLRLQHC